MHLRGTEQGLAGTMHLIEGMVAMLMTFTAMGIAATTFGMRFRLYTIATIILALGFGAWALLEAPADRARSGDPMDRGQGAHLLVWISIVVHRSRSHAAAPAGWSRRRDKPEPLHCRFVTLVWADSS